jgi:hypothetical protein
MAITYGDQIIENLETMRLVASLHPRLALLGVAVELEVLIKEIFPPPSIKRWIKQTVQQNPGTKESDAITAAARDCLRELAREIRLPPDLATDLGSWLFQIMERGNECRHTRTPVSPLEVDRAVTNAIEFVTILRSKGWDSEFTCEKHGFSAPFHLGEILERPAGSGWVVICPDCRGESESRRVEHQSKLAEYKAKLADWEATVAQERVEPGAYNSVDGMREILKKGLGLRPLRPFPVFPASGKIGEYSIARADEVELLKEEHVVMRERARALVGELSKNMQGK